MTRPLSVLVNGVPAEGVPVADRGLQYGDGVFETLAVVEGEPLLWERHLARLEQGCERLGFERVPSRALLLGEARMACGGRDSAVLKIIVTRGSAGRGYRAGAGAEPTRVVTCWPWPTWPGSYREEGVDLFLCETRLAIQPRLAGVKHLNRLEQVLARGEWEDGCAEGLMRDTDGSVVSGIMSNVFAVQQGVLTTPPILTAGVRGVMRECVRECAQALGLAWREQRLTLDSLQAAEEIFVTNSLIGLWPVKFFNTRSYPVGSIARKLQSELEARGYAHFR